VAALHDSGLAAPRGVRRIVRVRDAAAATNATHPLAANPADPAGIRGLPSAREELFNAATHAVGFALAVVGAVVLLWTAAQRAERWQFAACAIYSVTLVLTYAASTLSHVFKNPAARKTFRIADQALIFLFIAGSWTPVAATWLRGPWWSALHAALWAVALFGFVSKALFAHRVAPGTVSAILYLVIGWSPVLVAKPVISACPVPLLLWLVAGGIFYTVGLIFFRYDSRVPYFHAAWHVCVIAGSACHYFGILNYCAVPPQ
jgi:hemolysin III